MGWGLQLLIPSLAGGPLSDPKRSFSSPGGASAMRPCTLFIDTHGHLKSRHALNQPDGSNWWLFKCGNRRKRTLNLRHDLAVSRRPAPWPVLAKSGQSSVQLRTLRLTVVSKSGRDRPVVFAAAGAGRRHGFLVEGPRDLNRNQAVPGKGRTPFKRQKVEQIPLMTATATERSRSSAANRVIPTVSAG